MSILDAYEFRRAVGIRAYGCHMIGKMLENVIRQSSRPFAHCAFQLFKPFSFAASRYFVAIGLYVLRSFHEKVLRSHALRIYLRG